MKQQQNFIGTSKFQSSDQQNIYFLNRIKNIIYISVTKSTRTYFTKLELQIFWNISNFNKNKDNEWNETLLVHSNHFLNN